MKVCCHTQINTSAYVSVIIRMVMVAYIGKSKEAAQTKARMKK